MLDAPAGSARPIRVALSGGSDQAHDVLMWRLRRHTDSVRLVENDDDVDLILVDPYAGGTSFDASAFAADVVGERPIVIFTPGAEVDQLAFAMAAAVLGGRLRGWLSADLGARALVGSLEMVRAGTIVLHGGARV
jgi:hypothetical protein